MVNNPPLYVPVMPAGSDPDVIDAPVADPPVANVIVVNAVLIQLTGDAVADVRPIDASSTTVTDPGRDSIEQPPLDETVKVYRPAADGVPEIVNTPAS